MKIIIRDEDGIEDFLYEPESVKPAKRSIKERLIIGLLVIIFIPIWVWFSSIIVILPLLALNRILLINPAFMSFDDVTLTGYIITTIAFTLFLLFLEIFFPDTHLLFGTILYKDREIIINKRLKKVIFNNTYWIIGKKKQATIDFSNIKGIEIKTSYEVHSGTWISKKLISSNKTISLEQVPYERLADFAKAIDVPLWEG